MSPSRSHAARLGQEAVEIIAAGRYTNRAGQTVHLRHLLDAARQGTVSYPPDAALPNVVPSGRETHFAVTNETTLDAARRVAGEGHRTVALNFASAKHPGGGFLGGARAQEESLCRSSGLYACINGNAMYAHHARTGGGFYSNYAIYSPAVPVFRTDDGELLDEPYPCSFITSPAVNAGVYLKEHTPGRGNAVRAEMEKRVEKVLAIAAGHGHETAVFGAWGCGVFKNDPGMIADLFRSALATRFAGVFGRVVFAVLDFSADGRTIGPFEERFR
ncbi:MAG: hypothetical protein JWO38_8034 [Gemmataceae bacterium]|nr:hypothetical protein [Gemmataceae bacterium]